MPKRTSQNTLFVVLIVIIGLVGGYLYYSQIALPSQPTVEPPLIPAKDNLLKFETLMIDFSVLDNERYKSLQIFGESPVSPGVTGKKDIFAP